MLHTIQKIPFRQLSLVHQRAVITSTCLLMVMTLAGVGLDQITKMQSDRTLKHWESPDNFRSYSGKLHRLVEWGDPSVAKTTGPYFVLNLSYVRNPGAAWGFLSDLPDHIRIPFFNTITILCVLLIMMFFYFTPRSHRLSRFALALLLCGAVGNMIDRIKMNYVIDWIDVRWNVGGWYYAFPNFNVADMCISCGAGFILLDGIMAIFAERAARKPQLSTSV